VMEVMTSDVWIEGNAVYKVKLRNLGRKNS